MTQSSALSSLFIREAVEKDWENIVKLQQHFYPKHGWSMDYLKWEYDLNPAGKAQVWVAEKNGELVASYAAVPHKIFMQNESQLGWRMEHLLVREDSRNLGIHHLFLKKSREFLGKQDKGYAFAFPNERSFTGFKATGWKVFSIPLYHLSQSQLNSSSESFKGGMKKVTQFTEEATSVWKDYSKNFDYALNKTAAHLNWRYLNAPHVNYQAVEFTQENKKAYLVLKLYQSEKEGKKAHICEFFHNGASEFFNDAAIQYAKKFAYENRCESLSLWCSEVDPLKKTIERAGFSLDAQLNRSFVVYDFQSKQGKNVVPEVWRISMGDSDVF